MPVPSNKVDVDQSSVLVIQHVACETLGRIEEALNTQRLVPRYVRVFDGEPVPATCGEARGLIVMGGPMSVYESDRLPHLAHEMRLIESALSAGLPILGVCLGSQLLAHVLGSRVAPGPSKEIGWHRVRLTEAAQHDPLWAGEPSEFVGFHWHGDVFDCPPGCEALASSDRTACQAFRSGTSAYGLLFHMEVTEPLIEGMVASFPEELVEAGGTPDGIRAGMREHLAGLAAVGDHFFRGWAEIAAGVAGH